MIASSVSYLCQINHPLALVYYLFVVPGIYIIRSLDAWSRVIDDVLKSIVANIIHLIK